MCNRGPVILVVVKHRSNVDGDVRREAVPGKLADEPVGIGDRRIEQLQASVNLHQPGQNLRRFIGRRAGFKHVPIGSGRPLKVPVVVKNIGQLEGCC